MIGASSVVRNPMETQTLDAHFCVEALHEALEHYGPPEIFNSDQGSQFTSVDFTDGLKEAGIRISMDGKGRWMDNVFIERLWRSLKYEASPWPFCSYSFLPLAARRCKHR